MKIKELNESLNSPYDFQVQNYGPDLKFTAQTNNGKLNVLFFSKNKKLTIDFDIDGYFELTGKGDAFAIMATIKKIFQQYLLKFIENNNIEKFEFSAKLAERGRIKIYDHSINFISGLLPPDWQFEPEIGEKFKFYRWSKVKNQSSDLKESMTKIYPFTGPQVFQHSDSDIVEFRSNLPSGTLSVHFIVEKSDQLLEISFDVDGEQELTGGGNQFAIFATVIAIIKSNLAKIVKQYNIKHVEFSATRDEPSRVRLYQRRMMPILDQVFASPELSDQNWVSSINADDYKAKFIWQLQDSTLN